MLRVIDEPGKEVADLMPEAWIAPPTVRQLRALLRHRIQLDLAAESDPRRPG
jgi:hypothetical protein